MKNRKTQSAAVPTSTAARVMPSAAGAPTAISTIVTSLASKSAAQPSRKAHVSTTSGEPKYVTPKMAAVRYSVHKDFFRKCTELRRYRIVVNSRTHLYPVDRCDAYFAGLGSR